MTEYQLSCTYEEFQQTVRQQIEKFSGLRKMEINGIEQLQTARKDRSNCYRETIEMLNDCFLQSDNELVRDFAETQVSSFQVPGIKKTVDVEIKEHRDVCQTYISALEFVLICGSLSDLIKCPEEVDLEARARMSVEDRQLFILKKLSEVNTGAYHDVRWILEANGVKLRHYNEVNELVRELNDIGLVDILGSTSGLFASITIQGIKYLEGLEKPKEKNTETGNADGYEEMCSRVDEVLELLAKAGVEREILFEEMQELKEMYLKLGKKNWRQLALGKLAELAIGKIVENDSIGFIYEKITGEHLKLLP